MKVWTIFVDRYFLCYLLRVLLLTFHPLSNFMVFLISCFLFTLVLHHLWDALFVCAYKYQIVNLFDYLGDMPPFIWLRLNDPFMMPFQLYDMWQWQSLIFHCFCYRTLTFEEQFTRSSCCSAHWREAICFGKLYSLQWPCCSYTYWFGQGRISIFFTRKLYSSIILWRL